jgi:hypothetical protein
MGKLIKKKTFEEKRKRKKKKKRGKNITLDVDKSTLGFGDFLARRKPKPLQGEGKES